MFDYFEYREKTFTWSLGQLRCLKCKRFDLVSAQASFTVMHAVVFVNVVDQNVDLGMCADSRMFIKCLLIVVSYLIVIVVSPLVFSFCCVFDFFSLDSGTGSRQFTFGAMRSEVLHFFALPPSPSSILALIHLAVVIAQTSRCFSSAR